MSVNKFIDLLTENRKLPIQDQPEWISSQIERMLSGTVLNVWRLGDPIPTVGLRVLIGIAAWSGYDLRLLDALNQICPDRLHSQERIDILDIDVASRASGGWDFLESIVPRIGKIYQTPVVGIWENGTLAQKGSGAAGRNLIIERYGLNHDEIIPRHQ